MATDEDRSDEEASGAQPPPPWRAALNRRTLALCVAIAAVAAVVAVIVSVAMVSDDDAPSASATPTTATGSSTVPQTAKGTLTPAKVAPSTPFSRFDGSKVTLADYKGQKLVVNFFASTCVPCKKEMPALDQAQRDAGDEVTFLGIAAQDDPDAAQALVKRTRVTYDVGQDPDGTLFYALTGSTLLPATAFIAADGTVMEVVHGAMDSTEIRDKISSNLLAGG
ncbi:hypothetical protein BH10ACT1_BH10ACT1_42630 [soil metagenome]